MTTFVLVPGAGGQAWYWHRVVERLEAQGHEAVAVASASSSDHLVSPAPVMLGTVAADPPARRVPAPNPQPRVIPRTGSGLHVRRTRGYGGAVMTRQPWTSLLLRCRSEVH